MNVCIIGEGLTSLALAKNLINKKINVHIYYKTKIQKKITSRTIGISKNNLEFFKKEIFEITKINYWKIKKIEIYYQKLKMKISLILIMKKMIYFIWLKMRDFMNC